MVGLAGKLACGHGGQNLNAMEFNETDFADFSRPRLPVREDCPRIEKRAGRCQQASLLRRGAFLPGLLPARRGLEVEQAHPFHSSALGRDSVEVCWTAQMAASGRERIDIRGRNTPSTAVYAAQ